MTEGVSITAWLEQAKADPKVAAQPLVIIVALAFLAWRFLYSPQQALLQRELRNLRGVQDQIAGLEAAVAEKDHIALQVHEYRKAMEAAERLCYKKSEAALFLQHVRAISRQAKVEVRSISPQPTVPRSYATLTYEHFPVRVSFEGTFAQLGIFLRLLETQEKLIFAPLPPLHPDASGVFRFDLTPTAILIPDVREAPPAPVEAGYY